MQSAKLPYWTYSWGLCSTNDSSLPTFSPSAENIDEPTFLLPVEYQVRLKRVEQRAQKGGREPRTEKFRQKISALAGIRTPLWESVFLTSQPQRQAYSMLYEVCNLCYPLHSLFRLRSGGDCSWSKGRSHSIKHGGRGKREGRHLRRFTVAELWRIRLHESLIVTREGWLE